MLELILFTGLIAHGAEVGQVRSQLARHDKDSALKLVERLNPYWFPVPFQDVTSDKGERCALPLTAGFLQRDDWGRAWGEASSLLHARNPFRQPNETLSDRHTEMVGLQNKLLRLLDQHFMELPDGTRFAAQMQTHSGGCRVYLWAPELPEG